MAAGDIATTCFRGEPARARLCHPAAARPPRRRHAHLGQLLPHRYRLLRLPAVDLFRPLTRTWRPADAGVGRRLGSRDDRPAFLAEGAPLVRAPATDGPCRRGARPCPIAARRNRSGPTGYRSGGRSKLDPRANNPAVTRDAE